MGQFNGSIQWVNLIGQNPTPIPELTNVQKLTNDQKLTNVYRLKILYSKWDSIDLLIIGIEMTNEKNEIMCIHNAIDKY